MLESLYQPSVWNVVVQLLTNILSARVSTVVLTVGLAGLCNHVLIHSTVLITEKFGLIMMLELGGSCLVLGLLETGNVW